MMGRSVKVRELLHKRFLVVVVLPIAAVLVVGGGAVLALQDGEPSPGRDACWDLVYPSGKQASGSVSECGEVLESAMTGRPAGVKPAKGDITRGPKRVEVLERVVAVYTGPGAVAVPPQIRRNLANALACYPQDVNEIISKYADFADPLFSTTPNDVDVSKPDMLDLISSIVADDEAFEIIHGSQMTQVARSVDSLTREELTTAPGGATDRARGVAQEAGYVVGSLYEIHAKGAAEASDGSSADVERYGWPRLEGMLRARMAQVGVREDGQRAQQVLSWAKSAFDTAN